MKIAIFREMLAFYLLHYGQNTECAAENVLLRDKTSCSNEPQVHHLVLTEENEGGRRSDRRKRHYCTGCYSFLAEERGREIAKKTAKKVVTVCSTCPGKPAFCYDCFPLFHP